MERVAIYPGSFDPLTNGHVSIIERGLHIFDKIIVGIAINVRKEPLFNVEEREAFIRESFPDDNVEIATFQGLLVDYCRERDVAVILRGLRAVSDFEYELQMANMNRKLDDTIDTVFMMTEESDFYVSSSLVKEVARFGGKVEGVVPRHVEARLVERFAELDQDASDE
ncbi:MAG: pantetheine-phosphate adenylyltransferase [Myxococcota bacterium]